MRHPESGQIVCLQGIITDVMRETISVILLSVAAILFAYSIMLVITKPVYETTAELAVLNTYERVNTIISTVVRDYEILNEGTDSTSRLVNAFQNSEWKDEIAARLGNEDFIGSVEVTSTKTNNILKIKVQAEDPHIVYAESLAIIDYMKEQEKNLVGGVRMVVIEPPKMPEKPEESKQIIIVSILAGIAVIFISAYLLIINSLRQDKVHNVQEARIKTKLEWVMGLPLPKGFRTAKAERDESFDEKIQLLASDVINKMTDRQHKVLLVAGVSGKENISTLACNLAASMSENDRKITLIDLDFRSPSLYRILNMQDDTFTELSSILIEEAQGNAIYDTNSRLRTEVPAFLNRVPGTELQAVLNRTEVSNAMDLYGNTIRSIICNLADSSDFIVIDTALACLYSDSEELAAMSDESLVVINANEDGAAQINELIGKLGGQKHVMGVVLGDGGVYER